MYAKFLIVVIGISVLTSCGFKLRGSYDLPHSIRTLHITESAQFNPLIKVVETRLKQNNVTIIDKFNQQTSVLTIMPEQFQRQTLSLLPNGQIAEYKLVYLVNYQLQQPNKTPLSFRFELTREFQDDPNNALAKERERELILSELRVMASDRILSQLNSVQ